MRVLGPAKQKHFGVLSKATLALSRWMGKTVFYFQKKFLEYAKIESEVLFVPHVGKSLKLWNPDIYESSYGFSSPEDYEQFDAGFFSDVWMGDSSEKQ